MAKRIICILLSLILCMGVVPFTASAAEIASGTCGAEGDNLTWVLTDDGTLTISGTGEMVEYDADNSPFFAYNNQIDKIIIESGVTTIGEYAFYEMSATSVVIPATVTTIGMYAFIETTSLEEVIFLEDENVETKLTICGMAFNPSGIKTLIFPKHLDSIGVGAFVNCRNLTKVVFNGGVKSIGAMAFGGAVKLDKIVFMSDAPRFGEEAFDCVTATVYYPANNPTWTPEIMHNYSGTLTYEAVESTSELSGTCGAEGDNLTWILTDDGTLTISGSGAMQDYAYANNDAPWYTSAQRIMHIIFDGEITHIGSQAFRGCENVSELTIPASVSSMGVQAFALCKGISSIVIPNSVSSLEEGVFYACSSLKTVTIPNGVVSIGGAAFSECSSLETVTIPESITHIGDCAFDVCSSLSNITFTGNTPTISDSAFSGVTATVKYPVNNTTWTSDVMQNYGGTLTWVAQEVEEDSGYSAGLSSLSSDAEKGDTVTVNVNATHESDSTYAASEIVLTYDSGKLQFNEAASTLGNATVKAENGTISLQDYGESKNLGNGIYVFAFDAIADGQATVTLTSAAFVNKDNAAQSDLISATISPSTLNFTIQKAAFGVTLPNIFTGKATVTEGENYTFTKADSTNYDYGTATATMNGQNVVVTDNGDGSYTIANVTGALVISGTRTEKTYTVSFSGNGAADVKDTATAAVYNTAYSFTMPSASGWAYALDSLTIGGKAYTGYSVSDSVYTIPGSAINGDIAITITKTQTNAGVVVEGSGAGSASSSGGTVEVGKDYTMTITPEAGYTYTVTATINGEPVEVINNGDNTYTVKNVTGNLKFNIEKVVIVSGVSVAKYLSLDGTTMWLVKNTTPVADGKVPTYDGQAMFYSEEYNAYCYLVIAETLTLEDAQKKVGITDGTAATVDYESMDVNGTGKLDASDAQLTYNIYKADYSGFTSDVTLEKFLMADVNGDGIVNLEDSTAIVNKILN